MLSGSGTLDPKETESTRSRAVLDYVVLWQQMKGEYQPVNDFLFKAKQIDDPQMMSLINQ
jgi:hypothetical protein